MLVDGSYLRCVRLPVDVASAVVGNTSKQAHELLNTTAFTDIHRGISTRTHTHTHKQTRKDFFSHGDVRHLQPNTDDDLTAIFRVIIY